MSDDLTQAESPAELETRRKAPRAVCAVSGREIRAREGMPLGMLRPNLAERIRRDHPDLDPEAFISGREIARYRALLIEDMLRDEHGEITHLEREVIESLARHETVSENVEEAFEDHRTMGEILSDKLASFGGSWAFLSSFGVLLVVWMALNIVLGEIRAFDPYPFILLNLVLSCIAAVQAPIIMMSQRRQEAKDRLRSLNDYRVTLKAELEIRHLHEKMDHLIKRQWERLAAMQQIQIELLEELTASRRKDKRSG